MKRTVLFILQITLLCLALLSGGALSAARADDVVLGPPINFNGGFEEGTSQYYFTDPELAQIDGDEVFRGQFSLRVQGNGKAKGNISLVTQTLPLSALKPGATYLFSCAVKAQNVVAPNFPAVQVRASLGKGLADFQFASSKLMLIKGNTDWAPMQIVLRDVPPDMKSLGLWLRLPAASMATVWFDDIQIREIIKGDPPEIGFPADAVPSLAPNAPLAPKTVPQTPANLPNATNASAFAWDIDLNHDALGLYERGDTAFVIARPKKGMAPGALPVLSLWNHRDEKLADLQASAPDADGAVKWNLPSDRLGYFEVRAGADNLWPALGSRPAGKLTFSVVEKINPNPTRDYKYNFLSAQGLVNIQLRDGKEYGWDAYPYLGLQAQGLHYDWRYTERDAPNTFDQFAAKDKQPEWTRESKRWPYFHLSGIPMWAVDTSRLPEKERTGKATFHLPPKDWAQYEAYLEEVVPYIAKKYDFLPYRTYEVAWEPVSPWGWYGTSEELVRMFEIAHRVVHKYDPNGRVAGATLSALNDTTLYEKLLQAGLGKTIDVVSFHPYKGYPPEKASIGAGLDNIRELTKKYVGHDLPFIGTEYGYPESLTGGANNQAYGLTTSVVIFKGEGAAMHTLFYLTDYASEPGFGMMYNLVPGLPFSPNKVSPKPGIALVRAAIDQIGTAHPVGKLDYLGADIWGYVFHDDETNELLAAIWDASGADQTISFETGQPSVQVIDSFGNRATQKTDDGKVLLPLRRSPIYVRGLAPALYETATPLLQGEPIWRAFRGQKIAQTLRLTRDLPEKNVTLSVDAPSAIAATIAQIPMNGVRDATAHIELQIAPDAPLGPVAGSVRIRGAATGGGATTLYRGVQRIEIVPELDIAEPQLVRQGNGWQMQTHVKNVSPFAWRGQGTLNLDGAPQTQSLNVSLAPGAETTLRFDAVPPKDISRVAQSRLELRSESGSVLSREASAAFFSIVRASGDIWNTMGMQPLRATDETIFKMHPNAKFGGNADLSAEAGYAYDATNLYVQYVVTDDIHRNDAPPQTTWSQDSLQLAFDVNPNRASSTNLLSEVFERSQSEWGFTFSTVRGPEIYLYTAPGGSSVKESALVTAPGLKLEGGRVGTTTTYRVTMPWNLLDPKNQRGTQLGIAGAVNDSDAATEFTDRRALLLFSGIVASKDPALYGRATLEK